jgi:hypothetical protein
LVRNRPEEAVLGSCKVQDGLGPFNPADFCMQPAGGAACQGHSKS